MKDVSLKFKNYKCFGEELQGFESILPINIIIGRNNSGKSSLLDLIKYAISPFDLSPLAHKNKIPEVALTVPLSKDHVQKVFRPGTYGGSIPRHIDHWSFGKEWVGERLTVLLKTDKRREFFWLSKKLPGYAVGYQGHFAEHFTNPFDHKIFKHLKAERDIHPEPDGGSGVTEN
ncbi:MAG: AAA family ATPase, partial [Phycisphaerales bacterium]